MRRPIVVVNYGVLRADKEAVDVPKMLYLLMQVGGQNRWSAVQNKQYESNTQILELNMWILDPARHTRVKTQKELLVKSLCLCKYV